eukprot:403376777
MTRIGLLVYFLTQIVSVMQRSNYQLTKSTVYYNAMYQPIETVLTKDNFDISFSFYNKNRDTSEINYNEYFEYLSVNISQVMYVYTSDTYLETVIQIPIEICGEDRFGNQSQVIKDIGIANNAHCAQKDFNIKIKGSLATSEGAFLRITVQKCIQERLDQLYAGQGKKCRSNKEIEELIPQLSMDNTLLRQYFQEADFEDPIKSSIYNEQHTFQSDKFIENTYYLTKKNVKLEDSYLASSLENRVLTFNSFDLESTKQRELQAKDMGAIMDMTFYMSDKEETTKRSVTTLLEAISNTGGFMSIVLATVQILIAGIQQSNYNLKNKTVIKYLTSNLKLILTKHLHSKQKITGGCSLTFS